MPVLVGVYVRLRMHIRVRVRLRMRLRIRLRLRVRVRLRGRGAPKLALEHMTSNGLRDNRRVPLSTLLYGEKGY